MAAATTVSAPMISLALPQSGRLRLLAQIGLAVFGTVALTLSAKTKVVLGPVDLSLQTTGRAADRCSVWLASRRRHASALSQPKARRASRCFSRTPEKGLGIPYMLGTTGGYLAGFVVMAGLVGWAADRGWDRNVLKILGVMILADAIMLLMGTGWLATIIGAEKAWQFGMVPFVVPDLIKAALAATLIPAAWSIVRAAR